MHFLSHITRVILNICLVAPEGKSTVSISTDGGRTNIAVEEEVTFTCSYSGDSNPDPNRYTFYKDQQEEKNETSSEWGPISSTSVNDGGSVSCVASSDIGQAQESGEMQVTVEGINR